MARTTKAFFSESLINVQLAQTETATIVVVETGEYSASGTAKKDGHDKHDPDVGANLALSRALDSLSSKLLKDANGILKQQDEKQRQRVLKEKALAEAAKDNPFANFMKNIVLTFRESWKP